METLPHPQLVVGTRLYVKTDSRIMPRNAQKIINRLGGIRIIQGSTVEILEIKDNAARIQVYKMMDINLEAPTAGTI